MRFITLISIALAVLTATAMPLAARSDAIGVSVGQGDLSKGLGKVESTIDDAGKSAQGVHLRRAVTLSGMGDISQVKNAAEKTVESVGKEASSHVKILQRSGDVDNDVINGVIDKVKAAVGGATDKAKGADNLIGDA